MKRFLLLAVALLTMGGVMNAQSDPNLIAIEQENQETGDYAKASKTEGEGYTAYTATTSDLTIAIKVKNIDVKGCDYAIIKFAEGVPAGWAVSFWSGMNFEGLNAGDTEYKFDFATGAHADAGVKNDVLPEITLMTNPFGAPSVLPSTVKVEGIYIHKVPETSDATFTIENSNGDNLIALDQENLETDNPHADKVEGEGYTAYTATTNSLTVAIKNKNIDVTGCNYAIMKFAEPVPAGWAVSFWSGMNFEGLNAGDTEYKFDFATGAHADAGVKDNVLPEITLMTNPFGGPSVLPSTVKVEGIYLNQPTDEPSTRTYCFDSALDFTDVEGLEAYILTGFNAKSATLKAKKVTKVPAGTGLYLVGNAGKYTVPAIDEAEAIEGNMLVGTTEEEIIATEDGDYTNLVLAGKGNERGFHPIEEDGPISANKAYLQLPTEDFEALTVKGAPLRIIFDNEDATAITKLNAAQNADNAWYTLSGAKLHTQPTAKGIYINNGKTFMVK